MKKIFSTIAILSIFAAVIFLDLFIEKSFEDKEPQTYDTGYEDGYSAGYDSAFHEGFSEGYHEGYNQAMYDAPEIIEEYIRYDLSDLAGNITDEYGLYLEEVVQILDDYAEGKPVQDAELKKAAKAISQHYYDIYDLANEISDYSLDQ